MKKIFLIFFFFSSLITISQQWYQLSPGIDEGIYDVFCVDAYNVYFTTYSGPLLKTTDGGLTWQIFDDMTYTSAIYFINQDTGYVGGILGNVYRTEDGGDSWIIQNIDSLTYIQIEDIKMISADTIFVNASFYYNQYRIYLSFNGGQSWDIIKELSAEPALSMCFLDNGYGYTIESDLNEIKSTVYRTNDYGSNWEELIILEEIYSIVYFQDTVIGYLGGYNCGYNPTIISKTNDGGNTWNIVDATDAHWITRFDFPDPSYGYFSGEFGWSEKDLPWGLVEMSEDEGNSWDEIFFTYYFMIHSLDFVAVDTGYIVGEGMFGWPDTFIMRTFDVEVSEKEIEHPGNPALTVSPNPFNKSTSLNYELANPGNVEFVVFDINNIIIEKFNMGYCKLPHFSVHSKLEFLIHISNHFHRCFII